MRPLLEYACPAWNISLNQEQSRRLENIQKRAVNIIYGHGDYVASCSYYKISPLVDRRNQLCKQFFIKSVLPETGCLHYLLPPPRNESAVEKLRHYTQFMPEKARTSRSHSSFIMYALINFYG